MTDIFPSGVNKNDLVDHFKKHARSALDDGFIKVGESHAGRVRTAFTLFPLGLKHT